MSMTKGQMTREHIIRNSAELFLKNGFYNTGLSAILKEAGVPKGSFYFHFKSKSELGIAVASYFRESFKRWFMDAANRSDSWESFVGNLADDIRAEIKEGSYYGCPFTSFATETAVHEEKISVICTEAIREFIGIFQGVMKKDGISEKESLKRAGKAMAVYEGMLVYYRISGSRDIIDAMEGMMIEEGKKDEGSNS